MNSQNLKISCFGAGYVGGPTMAVMAKNCPFHKFYVYDLNKSLIEKWNNKQYPIFELGLSDLIEVENINLQCKSYQITLQKNIFFTNEIEQTLTDVDIIFLSVNTPTKSHGEGQNYALDTSYIENCVRTIGNFFNKQEMNKQVIIVEKSTVPVQTSKFIKYLLKQTQTNFKQNQNKFTVLSNPEFLSEGNAILDLLNPDRVIIGGESQDNHAVTTLKQIYLQWVPDEKIIITNIFSSELSKIVANSFLAQRVSSINSISAICEKVGADINELKKCIATDTRIGAKYLNPSCGFGGSCLGKDLLSLIYLSESLNLYEVAEYWRQVYNLNNYQKKRFAKLIINAMFNNLISKKLTIFGITFKANTNDVRESAAISIIDNLLNENAILTIYDPQAQQINLNTQLLNFNPQISSKLKNISFSISAQESIHQSHAIIILTEWNEFTQLNYEEFITHMISPSYIFDGRNILEKKKMEELGYLYYSLGR